MNAQHVAIAGSTGRMGRALIEAVLQSGDFRLKAALEAAGQCRCSARMRASWSAQGAACAIRADVEAALDGCDVLIDFTRPEGTLAHLEACRARGVRMVIGTTGFQPAQKTRSPRPRKHIAIAMAPNFSVGVNVTFKLSESPRGR